MQGRSYYTAAVWQTERWRFNTNAFISPQNYESEETRDIKMRTGIEITILLLEDLNSTIYCFFTFSGALA